MKIGDIIQHLVTKIDNKISYTNEDIVCVLINCTKEQLCDDVFLDAELEDFCFYQLKNMKNWHPIPRRLSIEEYKNISNSDKAYYYRKIITPKILIEFLDTYIISFY